MKKALIYMALVVFLGLTNAYAQDEPMIGEMKLFAGNFAPRGWALCEGQLLPISQNTALFSILGTTYGGDGRTTFALPDLRGRGPIQQGNGPGLPSYRLGQRGGTSQSNLITNNLPSHNHNVKVNVGNSDGEEPLSTGSLANHNGAFLMNGTSGKELGEVTQNNTGNNVSVNNVQPFLSINYIIALVGTYPSRN
jgi:microcystin-dependent protein